MQYDPDESDRQHSVSMDAVLQAPNPFLDDTSSDEETGLPPVVRPFETDVPRDETISERHDNKHDKDDVENQLHPKIQVKSVQGRRNSCGLPCLLLFLLQLL